MNLLKKLWNKLFVKKEEPVTQPEIIETEEVKVETVDPQTNSMISLSCNYASNNADLKKMQKAIARRKSNLKIKEVEINSHIEKLDIANESAEDVYMQSLYSETKKKEQALLAEISNLLNLTDEEITQGYIDKVTDSYLKHVIKYARKARKEIGKRTNPVAKK